MLEKAEGGSVEVKEREFSFGHFEFKILVKHTHGDIQEGLGIRC